MGKIILLEKVAAGELGRTTGEGFFVWAEEREIRHGAAPSAHQERERN